MVSLKIAALAAVGLFTSSTVFAERAKPNDAQIAHIAYTAGQLDIEAAEQAKQKSKNKDVLAFAADMERDHKAVNEKALALVKKRITEAGLLPGVLMRNRSLKYVCKDVHLKVGESQSAFTAKYKVGDVMVMSLIR